MSRLITIPKNTPVEVAKGEISRNNERLTNLGLGVKALGELLFTAADAGELGKETAACTGYLLNELGGVISDTLNMNTMLSIHIQAAEQEGRK
ncbi:hypothetical protein C7I36_04740 [Zobellella taiwanensis]|uniref:Uncharacterized protein n=1 Tax=Zobellella taiwanensis TaxID=347535 RepID=A0A2P7R589_9GAMM|nr:hypothetical protein [Zobellella taiwanensis]PSJ45381.1 hypothetical protein C7I36_04740 [Zobellella taiwanensis]